jgi:hypothetical protein
VKNGVGGNATPEHQAEYESRRTRFGNAEEQRSRKRRNDRKRVRDDVFGRNTASTRSVAPIVESRAILR